MNTRFLLPFLPLLVIALGGCAHENTVAVAPTAQPAPSAPPSPASAQPAATPPAPAPSMAAVVAPVTNRKPTLYVVGDSTANSGPPLLGWGTPFANYFDPDKITVLNKARGGRSSRSYIREGLWDGPNGIVKDLQPGDIVLLQFGHNDGGTPSANRAGDRPSLRGLGEEAQDFPTPAGATETVHTFGYYMRKYVADAKTKGATVIVLTPTVRNNWSDGKVERELGSYGGWAMEVAKSQNVPLVDMNRIVADKYEQMAPDQIPPLYSTRDTTHSTPEGADFNAAAIVSGLKALPGNPVGHYLSEKGRAVPMADAKYISENVPMTSP